jgi:hypothetical protein
VLRSHDTSGADSLLAEKALDKYLASYLPSLSLMASSSTVSAHLKRHATSFGNTIRLQAEMASVVDPWNALVSSLGAQQKVDSRFEVPQPAGQCDLAKADWKNGTYAHRSATKPFRLKDGATESDSLVSVTYVDLDGDKQPEALATIHHVPAYTGGGGMGTMASEHPLLFAQHQCKARFLGELREGSVSVVGNRIVVRANVPYRYFVQDGRVSLEDADSAMLPQAGPCNANCTFNGSCAALSSVGSFGQCCESVLGPEHAAECRRQRGK